MARSGLIAALLALGSLSGHAQDALAGRVLLAAVTDARNRPLVDLDADDFVVHEDDQAREILSVRIADYPLVLVLDNGQQAAAEFEAIRQAASRFVTRIGERAVGVVTMADPPLVAAALEDDRETTIQRIEALAPAASTRRPLLAVSEASRLIQATGSPFAAVVVVSAGDRAAPVQEPRGLLASFIEHRHILHVIRMPAIALPGETAALGPDDLLMDLARRSGGRATTIYAPVSFGIAIDQVAESLATEMLVEYVAPAGSQNAADVRVGVAIPGTRVRGLGVWP